MDPKKLTKKRVFKGAEELLVHHISKAGYYIAGQGEAVMNGEDVVFVYGVEEDDPTHIVIGLYDMWDAVDADNVDLLTDKAIKVMTEDGWFDDAEFDTFGNFQVRVVEATFVSYIESSSHGVFKIWDGGQNEWMRKEGRRNERNDRD